MKNIKKEIIKILSSNARISNKELAERLEVPEGKIDKFIKELEKENIIRGYRAIINEDKLDGSKVKAIIQVKVRPEREGGFDTTANRISKFPEVISVYLISGDNDLELEVEGENLQDIAEFVASKLSTIEGVTSTATLFILKKYKESGQILYEKEEYKRLKVIP